MFSARLSQPSAAGFAADSHYRQPYPAASKQDILQRGRLEAELKRVFGTGLTQIPGIRVHCPEFVRKIGPDFTKFPERFSVRLKNGIMPGQRISGGKVLRAGTRKVKCRVRNGATHSRRIVAPQETRLRAKAKTMGFRSYPLSCVGDR